METTKRDVVRQARGVRETVAEVLHAMEEGDLRRAHSRADDAVAEASLLREFIEEYGRAADPGNAEFYTH